DICGNGRADRGVVRHVEISCCTTKFNRVCSNKVLSRDGYPCAGRRIGRAESGNAGGKKGVVSICVSALARGHASRFRRRAIGHHPRQVPEPSPGWRPCLHPIEPIHRCLHVEVRSCHHDRGTHLAERRRKTIDSGLNSKVVGRKIRTCWRRDLNQAGSRSLGHNRMDVCVIENREIRGGRHAEPHPCCPAQTLSDDRYVGSRPPCCRRNRSDRRWHIEIRGGGVSAGRRYYGDWASRNV